MLTCSKRLCFFHFSDHLNPPDLFALLQENMQRSAGTRGDAEPKKGAPPTPPAGHSVAAGKEQQQPEMTFTVYLNPLSGWRKTCLHPERSRTAEEAVVEPPEAGRVRLDRLISYRLFHTFVFCFQPPVSLGPVEGLRIQVS